MSQSDAMDILVTRELTNRQIQFARELNLNPIIQPAIRIVFQEPGKKNLLKILERKVESAWVFTSRNGVKGYDRIQHSIRREMGDMIEYPSRIYAVGDKTAEALDDAGLEARTPDRQDATGLAELLIRESGGAGLKDPVNRTFETVVHWCGSRSRKELKQRISKAGLNFVELEVYRTELNEMDFPENLGEAILFYSPSAVEAFRQSGGFNRSLPELFAIGNTTGEILSLESGKNVHIPSSPSTENLLKLVADILSVNSKQ
ncbi:MAG: uroporphyrinogen-III synthase [Balneolaceae bacterium]